MDTISMDFISVDPGFEKSVKDQQEQQHHHPPQQQQKQKKYQPSGEGGTRSAPATLHRRTACTAAPPAKSKMAARGPQNGRGGLERCLPLGFWAFPSTFAK